MKTTISKTQPVRITIAILTATIISVADAGSPPGASLGPVWTGGSQSAGGDLSYSLNINATSPGEITAKAQVKAKGWKATFPMLSEDVIVGASVVDSDPIAVPPGFTGPVSLKIKAYHNGKKIGKAKLLVTISAAAPASAAPPSTLYDVGFDMPVTLDANVAPTNGMGDMRTYAWTQTSGPAVALDDPASATPTFTTLGLTNFVWLDEHFGIVGIDSEQVTMSSYGFQVVVSDGILTTTGNVTVTSASVSPAQPNVPLGVKTYLKAPTFEHETYSWSLISKPAGSSATLEKANTRTPCIRPDVEGDYIIRDTVANVDVKLRGSKFISYETCAQCHGPNPIANVGLADMVTPWSQTGHATFFQKAIDGLVSDHYSENCIACHTVGFNKTPTADNNGFDDVAADTGWTFPHPLQLGNYFTMPTELKKFANIGCESCHGPGSQHPGAASESLDAAVCATCHQDGHYHTRVEQWESSPHFRTDDEEEFEHPATNPSCTRCHTPAGFVDTQRGKATVRTGLGKLTCQTCHDPHDGTKEHQVRIVDEVTLPSGLVLTGQGTSALCMYCHNARRGPASVGSSFPHGTTQAEVFNGTGGVEFGEAIGSSFHKSIAGCVTCHMAANPPSTSPDHNRVGDHTFSMSYINDSMEKVENIAACNTCHTGEDAIDKFDVIWDPTHDYDGDGTVEGVQSEVQGLLDIVLAKILSTGVTQLPSYPYWGGFSADAGIKDMQRKAVWNYSMINNDKSKGIHNTQYSVKLLQLTYTKLSEATGGNSFATDYPAAYLR